LAAAAALAVVAAAATVLWLRDFSGSTQIVETTPAPQVVQTTPTHAPQVVDVARTPVLVAGTGPQLTLQLSDDSVRTGETVSITVIARDNSGIDWLRIEGEPRDGDKADDPELANEREVDCEDRQECANVWELTATIEGRYSIFARARSSDGRRSEIEAELRVFGA
jgi:hypothetical protein